MSLSFPGDDLKEYSFLSLLTWALPVQPQNAQYYINSLGPTWRAQNAFLFDPWWLCLLAGWREIKMQINFFKVGKIRSFLNISMMQAPSFRYLTHLKRWSYKVFYFVHRINPVLPQNLGRMTNRVPHLPT